MFNHLKILNVFSGSWRVCLGAPGARFGRSVLLSAIALQRAMYSFEFHKFAKVASNASGADETLSQLCSDRNTRKLNAFDGTTQLFNNNAYQ